MPPLPRKVILSPSKSVGDKGSCDKYMDDRISKKVQLTLSISKKVQLTLSISKRSHTYDEGLGICIMKSTERVAFCLVHVFTREFDAIVIPFKVSDHDKLKAEKIYILCSYNPFLRVM
ncbi:hypothetical protein G9A89_007177 [Geosiphon pyriformis]|nr:hypothetical protein G9A89_007177 [Geosiphon pyriformis]